MSSTVILHNSVSFIFLACKFSFCACGPSEMTCGTFTSGMSLRTTLDAFGPTMHKVDLKGDAEAEQNRLMTFCMVFLSHLHF